MLLQEIVSNVKICKYKNTLNATSLIFFFIIINLFTAFFENKTNQNKKIQTEYKELS